MTVVSVPFRGVGCFFGGIYMNRKERRFPSPYGVWVVSRYKGREGQDQDRFRPLTGCGLFQETIPDWRILEWFPSPYGVWVVSTNWRYYHD